MIYAAYAAVSVERVGTAWTLSEGSSTCTCTWAKPDTAIMMGWPSSQLTLITTPWREGWGRGCNRQLGPHGALADLAGLHVGDGWPGQ